MSGLRPYIASKGEAFAELNHKSLFWEEHRVEADFPAEQPSSFQGPRFPQAYADARWSRRSCRASPQGPREDLGLNVELRSPHTAIGGFRPRV